MIINKALFTHDINLSGIKNTKYKEKYYNEPKHLKKRPVQTGQNFQIGPD